MQSELCQERSKERFSTERFEDATLLALKEALTPKNAKNTALKPGKCHGNILLGLLEGTQPWD